MKMTPPPYTRHQFIEPTFPEHNGDDFTAEVVQRLADARDDGERNLVPIQKRLGVLSFALSEGWCPPRVIENEIDHLNRVVSAYHLSRYLTDVLATLQEAEADLAIWQRTTPAQRDDRLSKREREKAEAAERARTRAHIYERQNAFYTAMFAAGISPIPMADLSEVQLSESDQKLCDAELEISNMGNHLA
ncbi:hypothetical protein [Bradyrhizobium sp. 6(2017)]|uniref:hypothetical protein n=1 Tax=Bradyrhizobium sp. 6(2017) TaxID=1197460 RepID=UPI0013E0EAEA|nr:hypothetical protein [Bradyrhizobium sp. 6(2017)]QIG92088.1 hypothetical protein G6P99_05940 [Bradyrhizobium sp. 6(2017)]